MLRTSPRARELARIDEKIERLDADLATARARVTDLETQLSAALARITTLSQPPAPAERRGLHFD